MPEPVPARKRPRRLLLFAPFILIALLSAGYAGVWLWASRTLGALLDERVAGLERAGYLARFEGRRIEGFPFRLRVSYGEARIASPSGWSLEIPNLEAQAYLHQPGHWVLVAPEGLTVGRPKGGPIAVKGQVLRASVVRTAEVPWRIVLQGAKLGFTTPPGAAPFSVAAAERMEAYLRPSGGPDGEGRFLVRVEAAKATPGTILGRVAVDRLSALTFEGRLMKLGGFRGAGWGDAVRAWARGGGEADQLRLVFAGGTVGADSSGGALTVGSDGRLVGALPLQLKEPSQALSAIGEVRAIPPEAISAAAAVARARTQGAQAGFNLVFQAGVTTLGPVKLGPSPKVG